MAIIQNGSIKDFALLAEEVALEGMANSLSLGAAEAQQETVEKTFFFETADTRGLTLSELEMAEGFPSFFQRLFSLETKLYFLAWTWDMKGLHLYPGAISQPETCIIPLTDDRIARRFIGQGTVLFPPQTVRSGLAVRVQVWESKADRREFGQMMQRIASIANQSALKQIIAATAVVATGGAAATVLLAQQAATELASAIGTELANSSDELVDYFEGYYSATEPWQTGPVRYRGLGSAIELNHIK